MAGLVLVGIIFLVVGGCWAMISPSGSDSDPPSAPEPRTSLEAEVRRLGAEVQITNLDEGPWTNCTVEINPGVIRGGYSQRGISVGPGETISRGLGTFTAGGGERFNPNTHAVETVALRCNTPTGRRAYFGSFR